MDENVRPFHEEEKAQEAWPDWMKGEYLDRNSIQAAHRAFIAGYSQGWNDAADEFGF